MKASTESALLVVALVLVGAFIASFVRGVLREGPRAADPILASDPPIDSAAAARPPVARGRVEVLNATGRSGLARRTTQALREAGFDVIYFGNAPAGTPADSSIVIDRAGNATLAGEIARALGIVRTRSDPDSTLLLDATVIVGNDWPG